MSTSLAITEPRPPVLSADDMGKLIMGGDLNQLTSEGRLKYYAQRCTDLGLDPLSKPFDLIVLNGKLTLYANKGCFEQLRNSRHISISVTARERFDDLFVVTARAVMQDGRVDEATGAVNLGGLKGEAAANAIMKAETKAKRRVTLSICGLGMLDETEVDSVAGAQKAQMDADGNLLGEAKKMHGHTYLTIWKNIPTTEHSFEQGSHEYCDKCAADWMSVPDSDAVKIAQSYTNWLKAGFTANAKFPESKPMQAADPVQVQSAPAPVQQAPEGEVDYSKDEAPWCGDHNSPMKLVKAGVSKASGKPYAAFWACSSRGCKKSINAKQHHKELASSAPVQQQEWPDKSPITDEDLPF